MNFKKRALSLLMCICMIVTLLPVAAFADKTAADVVYGEYDANGQWEQKVDANGSKTYPTTGGNTLTLSKTATPVKDKDNTYQIELKVESTQTTTVPGAAATVLVIDVSGSMQTCATCNKDLEWYGGPLGGYAYHHTNGCATGHSGQVSYDDSRLKSAVDAAVSFLDSYAGDTEGVGRYVSVVKFSDKGSVVCDWKDISTESGYNSVVTALNDLTANGGTNTQAGLKTAKAQFDKQSVSTVAADARNTILLTDGIPTYGNGVGDGTENTSRISKDTRDAATSLKKSAKLYTVCFGAEKDKVYLPDGGTDTCGNFLEKYVASSETGKTYAYNADNTDQLMEVFKKISNSITEGIKTGTVTDPMGENINFVDGSVNFVPDGDNTYKWELSDPTITERDGKTVYTYTLSYTVKLDTTVEDFDENAYYPTNGVTTFTSGDTSYNFPVPGVKGTAPRYTVTYDKGAHGTLADSPNKVDNGNVVYSNIKRYAPTPDAPTVNPEEGYYFIGWEPAVAEKVTADATYTAQYAAKGTITITANSADATYDGTDKTAEGYTVEASDGKTYTVSGITASVTKTDAGTYTNAVTGTPVIKDADGNNVTERFTVKTVDGKLTIAKRNVTLTSATDSKPYDGTALTNDTITVGGDGFAEGEGATYNVTGSQLLPGTSDNEFAYELNSDTKAANYNISKLIGKLTVTDRTDLYEITVTAKSGTATYDGTEKSVSGFLTLEFTVNGQDYTVEGLSASATGINAGTYTSKVTGTAVVKDAAGNDVTKQFDVETVDGTLTINPNGTEVTVTITGNHDSKVYSGAEQSVEGYTTDVGNKTINVALKDGINAEAKGTNVGTYNMGLTADSFVVTSDNYNNIKVVVVDGYLDITPITDETIVTITGNHDSKVYTGAEQSVEGYTTDVGNKTITVALKDGVNAEAKGTDVGNYKMGLTADDFVVTSKNYSNIKVVVVDGYLEITPITDEVVVTITGNSKTVVYNGTEQSVEGYKIDSISNDLYSESDIVFKGEAIAKGTYAGEYVMGLNADQFENNSKNFSNVKFVVNDGTLTITQATTELKVTANSNSWVYDGKDHADGGYTVVFGDEKYDVKAGESATLSNGDTVTAVINKTVKHVADTAEGNNAIAELKVSNSDSYKTITKVDGTLTITAAPLTITAGSSTKPYIDGVVRCDEYTNTPLVEGDKIVSVKITGEQNGPGNCPNVASDAVIKNAAGADVTADYSIKYVDGLLEGIPYLVKDVHFNYIMGYKDGNIRPNNNISRAEVATIFFRLLTDESRSYFWKETNNFSDVADDYWACPAISTLTNAGILKGFNDGSFRPQDPITRAQMATIIARFAKLTEGTKTFNDIDGHWAQDAIELAAGNGWINGYEDGSFRPDNKITRAATIAMINRVLERHVESVDDLLPDMNVWKDNMDPSYTFYFEIQEATNYHECERIDNSPNEKWTAKLTDIDWTKYEIQK